MKTKIFIALLVFCSSGTTAFAQKTELLILPTIHGGHMKNVNYTFEDVTRIIQNFNPDVIGVEIRPEDLNRDTAYLNDFYQPEMITALKGFPGVQKVGIDFLGSDVEGQPLPANFSRDTLGDMGKFRLANRKLMRDSAIVKARIAAGLVRLKAQQGDMMSRLSANELLDGSYDKVTDAYTNAQTKVLKDTPYAYYDEFSVKRDQQIADNILAIAIRHPGKRVIILTGANHHNRAVKTLSKVGSVHLVKHVTDSGQ